MQTAVQIGGLCVIGAVLTQLVRRQKPELALCLAIAACAAALGLAAGAMEPVVAFFRRLQSLAGLEEALFAPLLKTLAIGVLTQISSAFCRDAGEQALARIAELGGTALALCAALPLAQAVLETAEQLMGG